MSLGSARRPNGTFERNFWKFSSVGGTPTNVSNLFVGEINLSIYQFLDSVSGRAREMETERVEDRSITYNPVPLNNGHTEFTRI